MANYVFFFGEVKGGGGINAVLRYTEASLRPQLEPELLFMALIYVFCQDQCTEVLSVILLPDTIKKNFKYFGI